MPSRPLIEVAGVAKTYPASDGLVHAVEQVSLDVPAGEFLSILGPSGCGKSTLLRMVAGLEDPTAGDVYIGDRRVNDVAPKERDVAMVLTGARHFRH